METWSEFQWWHVALMGFVWLGPITAFMLMQKRASKLVTDREHLTGLGIIGLITSFFWLIIYPFFVTMTDSSMQNFFMGQMSKKVAVVDKNDNIIAYNLRFAFLKPWPLSEYRIVSYPTEISFAIHIQPITKNPKVVPLEVYIAVRIRDGISGEQIREYILSQKGQEFAALEFKKQVFDFLQHRLPQDEAMRLNPFDPSSIERLHKLLSKELNHRLEFHEVTDVWLYIR